MASIDFYAGNTSINNLAGSGLGFFGGSFGQSVELNQWQGTTFITDGNGTTDGGSAKNIKYSTDTLAFTPSVVPATGLKYIPNSDATLNVRFTNSTDVRTQNVKFRIFDRVNKDHAASGVELQNSFIHKVLTVLKALGILSGGEAPRMLEQTLRAPSKALPIQVID